MSFVTKRLEDLHGYSTPQTAAPDLNDFWEAQLAEANRRPLQANREQEQSLSPYVQVNKVTYHGYDETPIHGWFLLPTYSGLSSGRLPCVVCYHGYSGSKGHPENYSNWLLQGYAVFAIDVRGQIGETGNLLPQTYGRSRGWMSQGLLDPGSCYYLAITVDAIRALQWAAQQPEVDPASIITLGGSQGGGLALITGALSDIPSKVVADIPNMCHMDYGIYHSSGSLTEAADFVSRHPEHLQQVLRTLSYFDMLNLAHRLKVPTMVSVSLKDPVCMPETIFAAYNRIEAPKQLYVYPFNGHSTSGNHFRKQVEFIRS